MILYCSTSNPQSAIIIALLSYSNEDYCIDYEEQTDLYLEPKLFITPDHILDSLTPIIGYLCDKHARKGLLGNTKLCRSQISAWLDFAEQKMYHTVTWLINNQHTDYSHYQSNIQLLGHQLEHLSESLGLKTYLIGHEASVADLVLTIYLTYPFKDIYTRHYQGRFKNMEKWMRYVRIRFKLAMLPNHYRSSNHHLGSSPYPKERTSQFEFSRFASSLDSSRHYLFDIDKETNNFTKINKTLNKISSNIKETNKKMKILEERKKKIKDIKFNNSNWTKNSSSRTSNSPTTLPSFSSIGKIITPKISTTPKIKDDDRTIKYKFSPLSVKSNSRISSSNHSPTIVKNNTNRREENQKVFYTKKITLKTRKPKILKNSPISKDQDQPASLQKYKSPEIFLEQLERDHRKDNHGQSSQVN